MSDSYEGKIVRFRRGRYRGAIGTVKEEYYGLDCFYCVVVTEGDADDDCHVVYLDDVEEAEPNYDETDDEELLGSPSFKPGDVVAVAGNADILYAVSEVITVNTGETAKYMYEVVPLALDDAACAYEASLLEYQYHDAAWGEYFSDTAQRGLPAWRDEDGYKWDYGYGDDRPYHYEHYDRLDDIYYCNYVHDDDYVRGTLPLHYMEYIWREYSIGGRIFAVFASHKNMREVMEKFNLKKQRITYARWKDELYDIISAIFQKIVNREEKERKSTEGMREEKRDYKMKFQNKGPFQFTDLELAVAAEADRRDVAFGRRRNHFPLEMSRAQMKQAIREAYSNAHKVGKRKIQKRYDARYGGWDMEGTVKGASLYEGESETYGLVIRFWYNFDMDLIEIAYPVMRNGDVGKQSKS